MKKILLTILCISLSTGALANKSIRIINNDKFASMTIKTQNCGRDSTGEKKDCVDNKPIYLPSLSEAEKTKQPHYTDISIPDDSEQFISLLNIASVSAVDVTTGKKVATGKYKDCEGSLTGDAIVLDPLGTNIVICNNRGFGVEDK